MSPSVGLALAITLVWNAAVFFLLRTYIPVVRYATATDEIRLLLVVASSSFLFWGIGVALRPFFTLLFPVSVVISYALLACTLLVGYRLSLKVVFQKKYARVRKQVPARKAALFGTGPEAVLAGQVLYHTIQAPFRPVAFIDGNRAPQRISGLPVMAPTERTFHKLVEDGVECILIPDLFTPKNEKEIFLELASRCGIREVRHLSSVEEWVKGISAVPAPTLEKPVNSPVEMQRLPAPVPAAPPDLAEPVSAPIKFLSKKVMDSIKGKRILVTGAAGAVGSELARQIIRLRPSAIILVDIAEAPLQALLTELREMQVPNCNIYPMIGDVTDRSRMEYVFDICHPERVFHAAAYKHVALLEDNPSIAILNNVAGTRNLAELAIGSGVETFVLVSTDAASNPTHVMGASKRIAEIYLQTLPQMASALNSGTGAPKFITTRFEEQANRAHSGTASLPEGNNPLVSLPEACELILEASAMGKGGEIFVFAGSRVEQPSGASGQWLSYEDLEAKSHAEGASSIGSEWLTPTYHDKIRIASSYPQDPEHLNLQMDTLLASAGMHYVLETLQTMRDIVPEYSNKKTLNPKRGGDSSPAQTELPAEDVKPTPRIPMETTSFRFEPVPNVETSRVNGTSTMPANRQRPARESFPSRVEVPVARAGQKTDRSTSFEPEETEPLTFKHTSAPIEKVPVEPEPLPIPQTESDAGFEAVQEETAESVTADFNLETEAFEGPEEQVLAVGFDMDPIPFEEATAETETIPDTVSASETEVYAEAETEVSMDASESEVAEMVTPAATSIELAPVSAALEPLPDVENETVEPVPESFLPPFEAEEKAVLVAEVEPLPLQEEPQLINKAQNISSVELPEHIIDHSSVPEMSVPLGAGVPVAKVLAEKDEVPATPPIVLEQLAFEEPEAEELAPEESTDFSALLATSPSTTIPAEEMESAPEKAPLVPEPPIHQHLQANGVMKNFESKPKSPFPTTPVPPPTRPAPRETRSRGWGRAR